VLLPDATNVNHTLVKDCWCWWYRKNALGNTVLEGLENEVREAKKSLWADPQPVPPWEWRKRKSREWAGLFLDVDALGFSLRRSQRDPDCWGEIIYVPVKQTSGRIDSDCIEWQWQSERGDVRGQRSIDPSARGAGDSTLIEARISGSWLEGQGSIFKKDFRKTQLCT